MIQLCTLYFWIKPVFTSWNIIDERGRFRHHWLNVSSVFEKRKITRWTNHVLAYVFYEGGKLSGQMTKLEFKIRIFSTLCCRHFNVWACIDSHHVFVEADGDRFSPSLSLHSVSSTPPSSVITCYYHHKVCQQGQQPPASVEVVKWICGHWFEHPLRFIDVEITGWFIYHVYILSSIPSLTLIVSAVWFFSTFLANFYIFLWSFCCAKSWILNYF